MALYTIKTGDDGSIEAIKRTAFASENIKERRDLQSLLRDNIQVITSNIIVVAEELSIWENSDRRVDLLAVDKEANLVVIELKRDDTGGHMELQALRYAAMVSPLTFSQVVDEFAKFLVKNKRAEDARETLLGFLGWENEGEGQFNANVRIILASADFHPEVGTTVSWLNNRGLDIRCVRMRPYKVGTEIVLDVQQIIPPPEVETYEVRVKAKAQEERAAQTSGRNLDRFNLTLGGETQTNLPKNRAVLTLVRYLHEKGITPQEITKAFATAWTWDNTATEKRLWAIVDEDVGAEQFDVAMHIKAAAEGKTYEWWRWFPKEEQLLRYGGQTFALSSQWGGVEFVRRLEELRDAFGNRPGVSIAIAKVERPS